MFYRRSTILRHAKTGGAIREFLGRKSEQPAPARSSAGGAECTSSLRRSARSASRCRAEARAFEPDRMPITLPPDLTAPSGRVIGIRPVSKALASALLLDDARALRQ